MVGCYLRMVASLFVAMSLLFAFAPQPPALAAGTSKARILVAIDRYIAGQMDSLKIPDIALGIVQGDQFLCVRGMAWQRTAVRQIAGDERHPGACSALQPRRWIDVHPAACVDPWLGIVTHDIVSCVPLQKGESPAGSSLKQGYRYDILW